jgi:hypothetical protein
MSDPLGLSIGTTNLVAARVGNPPITRRSVLGRPGQMLSGFVERVGDPVPLVASDGSAHQADELMVEALDGMIMAAGGERSADLSVAVPAHWNPATLRALREAMRARPRLSPNGTPARLVSDAVASLTALAANPGLPRQGIVALMDFGGGGTSITLADAASGYEALETVRLTDFSGEQIDQALLAHVLEGIADSDEVDQEGTTAVGSLAALREECRRAKETLSEESATDVEFNLPGRRSAVRVTRPELEALITQPLAAVLTELDDMLLRNRIAWANVSSVALVGGVARMPLINVELSKHTKTPLVTTPHPAFDAAVGAAIFAAYGADADAQTGVAPAPLIESAPDVTAPQAAGSSALRALAWSQDADTDDSLVPYAGEDYDTSSVRAPAQYVGATGPIDVDRPKAWHRLPQLALAAAAVVALVAVGGVAIALTSVDEKTPAPTKTPTTTIAPPPPPVSSAPPPPPVVAPPPPPPSVVTVTSVAPPPPPPETKYVEVPAKTTTTTTTQPTTTTPTTTTTTETTTTTTETTTSTTPAMTTSYITVPFVPVPIPIQVPNSGQPSQQQYPQQQYPQYQQPQYGQQYPY